MAAVVRKKSQVVAYGCGADQQIHIAYRRSGGSETDALFCEYQTRLLVKVDDYQIVKEHPQQTFVFQTSS